MKTRRPHYLNQESAVFFKKRSRRSFWLREPRRCSKITDICYSKRIRK